MELFQLGGWMMWPLLFASILALAIVIERVWVYQSYRPIARSLRANLSDRSVADIVTALDAYPYLKDYRAALARDTVNETEVASCGQAVVNDMETRLDLLANIARIATLMGLFGTIVGMIDTFAVIAQNASGIDMTSLAQGIWQALITTAAGLAIAIPAHFALAFLRGRVDAMGQALTQIANRVIVAKGQA